MALGCLEEEEVLAADVAGPADLLLPVGTDVPAQTWVLLASRKGTSFGRPTANIRSAPRHGSHSTKGWDSSALRPHGRHARERAIDGGGSYRQIAAVSTDNEPELYPCVAQGLLDHFDDRATLGDEMLPRRVFLLNPWLLAPGSEKRRFKRGQSALRTLGCILQLTFP